MATGSRSLLLALCVVLALGSAQVTFSRDWSGGKRSPPAAFDCGEFARLCRQFVYELKQPISSDKLGKRRRPAAPPRRPAAPPDADDMSYDEK